MKVLHVSHNFYPVTGGIEKNIGDICRGMSELGHQSDVLCLKERGMPEHEVHNGINIYRKGALDLRFYKISPRILGIIKEYDIVHVHGLGFFSDYLAVTKKIHKKPLVLSTHGGIFHTKSLSWAKRPYFYLWSRLALRAFDRIVAVSRSDMELFSGITDKMTFIPDSVDHGKFSSIKRDAEKGIFIFVGRMSKNKRIDRLIRAFSVVNISAKGSMLFIIGEDWDNQKGMLSSLAKELGIDRNVVFTGRIDNGNLTQFFKRAPFFLSASEYEGFGISVLEAMAAGIPVIVNDIDAFNTFVEDGRSGFIIDYSKPHEAGRKILGIMGRDDLQLISATAKEVSKEYDYKSAAKKLEILYNDVMTS